MPRTQKKPDQKTTSRNAAARSAPASASVDSPPGEVLTLAEAAAYLRVSEQQLLTLVAAEDCPGRRIGPEWRFFKPALQDWLRARPRTKQEIWAHIGAFKDDPTLDEMVREIYRKRGRPIAEES